MQTLLFEPVINLPAVWNNSAKDFLLQFLGIDAMPLQRKEGSCPLLDYLLRQVHWSLCITNTFKGHCKGYSRFQSFGSQQTMKYATKTACRLQQGMLIAYHLMLKTCMATLKQCMCYETASVLAAELSMSCACLCAISLKGFLRSHSQFMPATSKHFKHALRIGKPQHKPFPIRSRII